MSTVELKEFDPTGQYAEITAVVEKVGDGKSRIFKVERGKTRVEYYVVGFDEKGKKVVGMKALAIES